MKSKEIALLLKRAGEEMRFLGIDKNCKGVKVIFEIISGKRTSNTLTDIECQQITDAWNSRKFTPVSLYRRFKPLVETSEDDSCKHQNIARNVVNFFRHPEGIAA